MLVSTTEPKPFKDNLFCVDFSQIYELQVFEPPEELKLVIRERFGRGAWQNLAQVFLPLSEDILEQEEIYLHLNTNDQVEEKEKNGTKENTFSKIYGMEFASDIVRGR